MRQKKFQERDPGYQEHQHGGGGNVPPRPPHDPEGHANHEDFMHFFFHHIGNGIDRLLENYNEGETPSSAIERKFNSWLELLPQGKLKEVAIKTRPVAQLHGQAVEWSTGVIDRGVNFLVDLANEQLPQSEAIPEDIVKKAVTAYYLTPAKAYEAGARGRDWLQERVGRRADEILPPKSLPTNPMPQRA